MDQSTIYISQNNTSNHNRGNTLQQNQQHEIRHNIICLIMTIRLHLTSILSFIITAYFLYTALPRFPFTKHVITINITAMTLNTAITKSLADKIRVNPIPSASISILFPSINDGTCCPETADTETEEFQQISGSVIQAQRQVLSVYSGPPMQLFPHNQLL